MCADLFSAAADDALAGTAPLAERLRPRRLSDVVGQQHLVGSGGSLLAMSKAKRLPSLILWGPAGSGKTTLARLVANERADQFVALSAVTATVADIRKTTAAATDLLGQRDRRTIVFLDEIHRFTRTQQDALLPSVESGLLSLIGATTESPWATIVGPLLSRCTVLRLEPLTPDDLDILLERAATLAEVTVDDDARALLRTTSDGDGRKLLTTLEVAIAISSSRGDATVTHADARSGLGAGDLRYGTGVHYDSASAFIKWMRHSDPSQALAWMNFMLDGGEDPRFVARRMVIFASEDIGPADPRALLIADAAARAVESVGMPEARYNLAHAAGYLARAAKSRDVVADIASSADVERRLPPEMGD